MRREIESVYTSTKIAVTANFPSMLIAQLQQSRNDELLLVYHLGIYFVYETYLFISSSIETCSVSVIYAQHTDIWTQFSYFH